MTHYHDFVYLLKQHDNGDYSGQIAELDGCNATGKTTEKLTIALVKASVAYLKVFPELHDELCRKGTLPHRLPQSTYGRILSIINLGVPCDIDD